MKGSERWVSWRPAASVSVLRAPLGCDDASMYSGAEPGTTVAGLALVPLGLLEPQLLEREQRDGRGEQSRAEGRVRDECVRERAEDNAGSPFSVAGAHGGAV